MLEYETNCIYKMHFLHKKYFFVPFIKASKMENHLSCELGVKFNIGSKPAL